MAGFTERLAYIISANAKNAVSAFREVRSSAEKELGATESRISKLGSGAQGLGVGVKAFAGGLAGALLGGGGFSRFASESLDVYRQVQVWAAKVKTVFEDSAVDVERWADKNNESFGLSKNALAGVAASFGDLMKPMGFTAAQAAEMSQKVVGLSGALAAWTGGQRTASEVAQILSKSMLGERESLKDLGISILESEVQARVAEKGQDDLTGALLQQAKAVATQELIFEKSTDAQAAWADGSMDAVKSQNKLQAEIDQSKEDLGKEFAPIEKKATGLAAGLLKVVNGVRDVVNAPSSLSMEFRDWLTGSGDAADDAEPKLRKFTERVDAADVAVEEFGETLEKSIDATLGIPSAIDDVGAAFAALEGNAESSSKKAADAQDRLADAIESSNRRIRDAEQDVADAREDLGKISSGDRTDARRRLRDAEERIAEVRADSAEAIQEAKDNAAELAPVVKDAATAARETRGQMENVVTATGKAVEEMIKWKRPSSEILAFIQAQRDRMTEVGARIGANRTDLELYLGVLTKVYEQTKALADFTAAQASISKDFKWWGVDLTAGGRAADQTVAGTGGVTVNQFFQGADPAEQQRQAVRGFNGALRRRG